MAVKRTRTPKAPKKKAVLTPPTRVSLPPIRLRIDSPMFKILVFCDRAEGQFERAVLERVPHSSKAMVSRLLVAGHLELIDMRLHTTGRGVRFYGNSESGEVPQEPSSANKIVDALIQAVRDARDGGHRLDSEDTWLMMRRALENVSVDTLRSVHIPKTFSSAKVTFYIVPHGWQADIDISNKKEPVRGSICRDWGTDGPPARALLEKLVQMARTGEP